MKRWYGSVSVVLALLGSLLSSDAQGACAEVSGNAEFRATMDSAKAKAYYDMDLAAAILTLEEAEALLPCFNELIPTSDLTSFYLNKGAFLNDVGRSEEGAAAIQRAASVSARIRFDDPSLDKTTYLAFLSERDARFLMHRPELAISPSDPTLMVAVDGQPIPTQGTNSDFVPGWHFVQVGQGGNWRGTWVELPAGGQYSLVLTPEGASLGPWPEETLIADLPAPGGTQNSSSTLRSIGVGLGVGAIVPGLLWFGEEVAYRSGALHDVDGVQLPNYPTHFIVHRVSASASLALIAGSAGTLLLAKRRDVAAQASGQNHPKASFSLALSPGGIGLRGSF